MDAEGVWDGVREGVPAVREAEAAVREGEAAMREGEAPAEPRLAGRLALSRRRAFMETAPRFASLAARRAVYWLCRRHCVPLVGPACPRYGMERDARSSREVEVMRATFGRCLPLIGVLYGILSPSALGGTRLVPSQYATIQAGIDAAVAGDTVLVANGVYTGTGNKDLDFHGKAITVRSASGDPALCIIDCEGSGRGFYFHSGETGGAVVACLTIRNGRVASAGQASGAGVYCSSASPTLADCTITGNAASSSNYRAYGGGVYCSSASPTLTNCTISGNTASATNYPAYGGGVYCSSGTPTLTDCTISDNLSSSSAAGWSAYGGGVYCACDVTLANCTIRGNIASARPGQGSYGGGLYCYSCRPSFTGCMITGNAALCGGGVSGDNSTPTLYACTISGNTAGSAGGAVYGSIACWPLLTNCIISGNTATVAGAVYCSYQSSTRLLNSTISGNTADDGTGGVYCNSSTGTATVVNCILWGDGTEVSVSSGAAVVTYCDVQGGYAGTANINVNPRFALAGDFHLMSGSPCIDAGTNTPTGGLPAEDADGTPRPLDGNGHAQVVADMGAYEFNPAAPAIAVEPVPVEFFITEGQTDPQTRTLSIRNAAAGTLNWTLAGDAPWLQTSPIQGASAGEVDTVTLTARGVALSRGIYSTVLTVSAPQAVNSPREVEVLLYVGGTLHVPSDYPTIQAAIDAAVPGGEVLVADGLYTGVGNKDLQFHGKPITVRSTSGNAAACIIDCQGAGTGFCFQGHETHAAVAAGFTIRGGNRDDGGAVHCVGSSPTLANCIMSGNTSSRGGGVYCFFSSPTLTNCTIAGNTATYYGGGVYCDSSSPSPTLTNCTITRNTAGTYGGGVFCYSSNPKLANCILSGDTPQEIYASSATAVVRYSDVQGSYAGTGNLNLNPLFVNAAAGNYHLAPLSPCIDAGDPASDFSLEPEPDGGRINMGAYGNTAEAETKGWIYIDAYHIVRKTRVGRTLFEYDLTTTVRNASAQNVTNLVATLLAAPANVQVIGNTVNVGSVPAASTVESGDTFTIRVDRSTLVSPLPISWRVTYSNAFAEFTTLLDLGPPRLPGDVNCDGRVDFDDINPFVLALVAADAYYAAYEGCDWLNADVNGDGAVDFDDINPFVKCLVAGGCP